MSTFCQVRALVGGQVLNPLLKASEESACTFEEDILCSSFHYQIPLVGRLEFSSAPNISQVCRVRRSQCLHISPHFTGLLCSMPLHLLNRPDAPLTPLSHSPADEEDEEEEEDADL